MHRNIFVVMLFVLIVLPIMMLFANDSVFFVIIAVIMFVFSVKNLYKSVLRFDGGNADTKENDNDNSDGSHDGDDDRDDDELGILSGYTDEITDIDIERFELLAKMTRNLIIMLFYIYCIFQFNSIAIKSLIIIVLLYWLYLTINSAESKVPLQITDSNPSFSNIFFILINLSTVVIIILSVCNKFIRKVI